MKTVDKEGYNELHKYKPIKFYDVKHHVHERFNDRKLNVWLIRHEFRMADRRGVNHLIDALFVLTEDYQILRVIEYGESL